MKMKVSRLYHVNFLFLYVHERHRCRCIGVEGTVCGSRARAFVLSTAINLHYLDALLSNTDPDFHSLSCVPIQPQRRGEQGRQFVSQTIWIEELFEQINLSSPCHDAGARNFVQGLYIIPRRHS